MKINKIIIIYCLMSIINCIVFCNIASSDSCNELGRIQTELRSVDNSITNKNNKIKNYDKDISKIKDEFNRTYADQENKINDINNETNDIAKTKRNELNKRDELIKEMKQSIKEFRSGLYCSKCRRAKSQIEREEKMSFYSHLDRVKGTGIAAPPDVVKEALDKYEAKIRELDEKVMNIDKKIKKNEQRIDKINVERVDRQNSINNKIMNIENSKRESLYLIASDERRKSALKSSAGQYDKLCKTESSSNYDSLGYKVEDRRKPLESLVGKDLAAVNSAIEKELVDHAGMSNEVLFSQQDMPAGGRKNSMYSSWKDGERALKRLSERKESIFNSAVKYNVPPALVAAVANRESRLGAALDENGYGDGGKAYGEMQVDLKNAGQTVDISASTGSFADYEQGVKILKNKYQEVSKKFPTWTETEKWRAASAAYNAGTKNVRSKSGIDRGTTGNDYSGDVWAQAQWFALSGEFEYRPAVNTWVLP